MKKIRLITTICLALILVILPTTAAGNVPTQTTYTGTADIAVDLIGHYRSDSGEGGTEIVQYAAKSQKIFVVNGEEKSLDIIDAKSLNSDTFSTLILEKRIEISSLAGVATAVDVTSVAVAGDESFVAITVPAEPPQNNGSVVIMDINGKHLKTVEVGPLPDMLTVTKNNQYILVANEGQPNDDYTVDPEGSVSIIDLRKGITRATVKNATFNDQVIVDPDVRKANPNHTYAQNFEPEYITIAENDKTAYVALQESNAIAVLDIAKQRFTKVTSLGTKDYSLAQNSIDASNKDGLINLATYPILSMYQPDGIAAFTVGNKTYLATANEGDSQDYDGYSEEARVKDLAGSIALKATNYAGYNQTELDTLVANGLYEEDQLGRLLVSTAQGRNTAGMYETLYGFGGRSFSIFDAATMQQVYDSGNDFEVITALANPKYFNATNDENKFDSRSDDKGPEPEDVKVGQIGDRLYAFIGLERMGGLMIYDVTDPATPEFELYTTTRQFNDANYLGDLAPEGLNFIARENSPTGEALLLVANEVSGTITVFEVKENPSKNITILHFNDTHARVEAGKYDGMGFARMASIIKNQKSISKNCLVLDAGDTFHGKTFATLEKGLSVVEVMNEMAIDAMVPGNHDFNYGQDRLLELVAAANFDIIAANIKKENTTSFLQAYTIKEVDGIKIAIFGLATPETTYKTHPDNVKGLTFEDPALVAKQMVAKLQNKADVIIALCHLGTDPDSTYTSTKVAQAGAGIDLIVDGHSHTSYDKGHIVNGTTIVSAGEYDKSLGKVVLTISDGKIAKIEASLIPKVLANGVFNDDDTVARKISTIKAQQDTILSEVIGKTTVTLDGERGNVRTGETNLGNLITDAMLAESGAEIAITNGGGIRASIAQGDITKGHIITALPFGNYIVTKHLTGAEIKDTLEHGSKSYPEAGGSFPHVAGLSYRIDTSKEIGDRIVDLKANGKAIDQNHSYLVATNDFLAAGGDGYTMLGDSPIVNDFAALDEAVIDYISLKKNIAPQVTGRIAQKQVAPTPKTKLYVVQRGDMLWKIAKQYNTTWQTLQELNRLKNPHLLNINDSLIVPAN